MKKSERDLFERIVEKCVIYAGITVGVLVILGFKIRLRGKKLIMNLLANLALIISDMFLFH